jgi:hypothetical protein
MDADAAMGTSRKAAYKRFCFVGTVYPSEVRNFLESSAYLTYMARRRQRRLTSLLPMDHSLVITRTALKNAM